MIVHINSYPGVGKLTIGRILAERLGGRLLDNHSIYNVAFATTEFRSPEFYDTARAVRAIAYDRVLTLPADVPVVLTNAHLQISTWGNECWDAALALARDRGSALLVVVLACDPDENRRRIQSEDRDLKRKPRDPHMFTANDEGAPLIDRGGDHLLRLDVTTLSAEAAAIRIHDWIGDITE